MIFLPGLLHSPQLRLEAQQRGLRRLLRAEAQAMAGFADLLEPAAQDPAWQRPPWRQALEQLLDPVQLRALLGESLDASTALDAALAKLAEGEGTGAQQTQAARAAHLLRDTAGSVAHRSATRPHESPMLAPSAQAELAPGPALPARRQTSRIAAATVGTAAGAGAHSPAAMRDNNVASPTLARAMAAGAANGRVKRQPRQQLREIPAALARARLAQRAERSGLGRVWRAPLATGPQAGAAIDSVLARVENTNRRRADAGALPEQRLQALTTQLLQRERDVADTGNVDIAERARTGTAAPAAQELDPTPATREARPAAAQTPQRSAGVEYRATGLVGLRGLAALAAANHSTDEERRQRTAVDSRSEPADAGMPGESLAATRTAPAAGPQIAELNRALREEARRAGISLEEFEP